MKRAPLSVMAFVLTLLVGVSPTPGSAFEQDASAAGASQPKQITTRRSDAPSAAEIAAAKASGKVWVNMNTHIYHRNGRWYGKTKNGKFMTLDEAKKAGYKESHRG